MNITVFNKKYWVRHFGEPKNIRGYITNGTEDRVVSLNVHPLSTDQIKALPEGERKLKRLEAHGTDVLVVADEAAGTKGDLLLYMGDWYECVNAQRWDHTILSHLNYQFVLVPQDASRSIDTENPPEGDPNAATEPEYPWLKKAPIASSDSLGFVKIPADSGLQIDEDGYLSLKKGGDAP